MTTNEEFNPDIHLTPEDIQVDHHSNPSIQKINIKNSKTDHTREGISLYVGRTGNELCPVAAMLPFLVARGRDASPLFVTKEGKHLTRPLLVKMVKETLTTEEVDCSCYNGHSFRIGAATMVLAKGIPEATIQTLGHWKSEAYKQYIRIPRKQLAAISVQMSQNGNIS